MSPHAHELGPHSLGEEDLVERLRNLRCPEVSPEMKERCWDEFVQRIDERGDGAVIDRPADLETRWRFEFSRPRAAMDGLVPSRRRAVGRSWSRQRLLRPALIAG